MMLQFITSITIEFKLTIRVDKYIELKFVKYLVTSCLHRLIRISTSLKKIIDGYTFKR